MTQRYPEPTEAQFDAIVRGMDLLRKYGFSDDQKFGAALQSLADAGDRDAAWILECISGCYILVEGAKQ